MSVEGSPISLTITTDVFGDGPGCLVWTFGATGTAIEGRQARRQAKEDGWSRRQTYGGLADLCPDCSQRADSAG